ncbi:MAG TPA: protein translocase subunit SecF [Thermodesulfobacteriota bacterium]|nr:protein translocase subunit SecF [Thermodesulfobacteriota bacterium]
MELIRPGTHYDFIGMKKITLWISALAILVTIGSILYHGGLRNGVDFAGGAVIQVKFSKPVDISEVRNALETSGSKEAVVQNFGGENEFLIRVEKSSEDIEAVAKGIQTALQERFKERTPDIESVQVVGPMVGKDLKQKAAWAVILSMLGIMTYIAFRFHKFSYGLGGLISLFHDIAVTYGAISVLKLEYNLSLMAVVLTVIGFSINDTIVIFDRVRENMKKMKKTDLVTVFNESINECLGRTILTTGTVMISVLILFFFAGQVLHEFTIALIVGIVTGTYSTVYIASPVVLFWEEHITSKRKIR